MFIIINLIMNNLPKELVCLVADYCTGEDLVYFLRCYPTNNLLKKYLTQRIRDDYLSYRKLFSETDLKVPEWSLSTQVSVTTFIQKATDYKIPNSIIYIFLYFCNYIKDCYDINYVINYYIVSVLHCGRKFFGKNTIYALIKFFFQEMQHYNIILEQKSTLQFPYNTLSDWEQVYLTDEQLFLLAFDTLSTKNCNLYLLKTISLEIGKMCNGETRKLLFRKLFDYSLKNDMAVGLITVLSESNFQCTLNSFNI